jgi:hypothetical protein
MLLAIVVTALPDLTKTPAITGGVDAVVPTLRLLSPKILFLVIDVPNAVVRAELAEPIPATTILVVAVALKFEILLIVF